MLGFAFYLLAYFLMPSTVDETLRIGLYAPGLPAQQQSEQGLEATVLPSVREVREGRARRTVRGRPRASTPVRRG